MSVRASWPGPTLSSMCCPPVSHAEAGGAASSPAQPGAALPGFPARQPGRRRLRAGGPAGSRARVQLLQPPLPAAAAEPRARYVTDGMGGWVRQVVGEQLSNQDVPPGEQEESRCQRCISELKDIRLQLEACETRTVHRLRLPLDKEPAKECAQRIAEQQAGDIPIPISLPLPPPLLPSWPSKGSVCWILVVSVPLLCLFPRKRRPRWRGWARGLPGSLPRPRRFWPCLNRHLLPPLCALSWN